MELLRVENISKQYPATKALDNVSLCVEAGTTVGIYGKKGSGKRTLINIILGIVKLDKGKVFVGNLDITQLSRVKRHRIGVISITPEFSFWEKIYNKIFPFRSVEDYLVRLVPGHNKILNRKINKDEKRQIISKANVFGPENWGLHHRIYEQSGGQKQRIELGSCLIRDPIMIIIDDPFFGLDEFNALDCFNTLKEYVISRNIGFLFSMDIKENGKSLIPYKFCDKSYFLESGKIKSEYKSNREGPDPISYQNIDLIEGNNKIRNNIKDDSLDYGFDVFLSFKNSDKNGNKTRDSYLANDIYNYLTKRDLKVFFSNISLENLGVAAYQDAIDKVLDKVKVVIAIGTTHENFNSEWVRYEWSSFYNDILSGRKKSGRLFVYTEKIVPNELPRILRQNQVIEHQENSLETLYNFVANSLNF
jgi:lipopolysaccharide export system ATP-binding protein